MHRSPGEQSPRSAQKYALTCPQDGRFHPSRVTTDRSSWPLLRHRLLRVADGFEGFGVIPEELGGTDLALADRVDARQLHVRLGTATCATPDEPHHDSVADF